MPSESIVCALMLLEVLATGIGQASTLPSRRASALIFGSTTGSGSVSLRGLAACGDGGAGRSAAASAIGVLDGKSSRNRIGGHERRLAAQSLGDEPFGIRLARQLERAAETFQVGAVPRLARNQILGDEPRLRRLSAGDIGVGQKRLRAYIVASSPPSTQIPNQTRISAGM